MNKSVEISAYALGTLAMVPTQVYGIRAIKRLGLTKVFLRADQLSLPEMFSGCSDRTILAWITAGSLFEELIFRGAGSWLLGRSWLAGAAIALVFACLHSCPTGKWIPRNVPLPQLASGVWFWLGLRIYGMPLAMIAHAMMNTVAISLAMKELAQKGFTIGELHAKKVVPQ